MKTLFRKCGTLSVTLVLSFVLLWWPTDAQAKDTEFEFYYQHIEKVIEINNPEPEGWWENAKSFIKKGVNTAKKAWEKNITRRYFPGEGKKTWYSRGDSNLAYEVQRTRVKSEKHLLNLMGANSEEDLSDGQKALLAVYRHSKSEAIKERLPYGYQSKIKVMLSDTTGFDDPNTNPHTRRDFWPYAHGNLIQLSSGRYNFPGSDSDARSTFVHEFAHTMDRTIHEFTHPYGKDGLHYVNEMIKPRSAFSEGWAGFNEMLDSEDEVKSMRRAIKRIKIESKSEAGQYEHIDADSADISGKDLLLVEGINANILYRIATEIPNGHDKVLAIFTGTRWKLFRNLKSFSRAFARKYPDDAAKMAEIFDDETHGKLSAVELRHYAGSSAAVEKYIAMRGTPVEAQAPESSTVNRAAAPGENIIKVENMSNQDFSAALQKAHEQARQALNAYKEAIRKRSPAYIILTLQQELRNRQKVVKQLIESTK